MQDITALASAKVTPFNPQKHRLPETQLYLILGKSIFGQLWTPIAQDMVELWTPNFGCRVVWQVCTTNQNFTPLPHLGPELQGGQKSKNSVGGHTSLHWQVPRGPNLFSFQSSEAWICWCNLVKFVEKKILLLKNPFFTCAGTVQLYTKAKLAIFEPSVEQLPEQLEPSNFELFYTSPVSL